MNKHTRKCLLTSIAVLSLSMGAPCMAAPQGGVVSAGDASISHSGTKTDIHQHSNKAILDWSSFNIGADEHTQFHQPSSNAIALNRIHDTNASQIDGKLTANGKIMLINQSGVVFGGGAVIDVGSLTVSTADIDNDDFMAGNYDFKHAGKADAAIINDGLITAKEHGLVTLVAPRVQNNGIILASLGKVELAAADTFTLDLAGDGLIQVAVSDEEAIKLASNTGYISADGGVVAVTASKARNIVDSLVENSGVIEAASMQKRGGKIILGGGNAGITVNNGVLNASGRKNNAQGGQVEVLGEHIALGAGSLIDTSGTASAPVDPSSPGTSSMSMDKIVRTEEAFLADARRGGGSIMVGGDYLGTGDTPRAQTLYVDKNALTVNNGLTHGDGGRTIFWSDNTTDFNGLVIAQGGALSGHGGFLETSGKINLRATGFADLSPAAGNYGLFNKGTYLLDPDNITIFGNVDPRFVSTDTNVDIGNDLVLWLDANDLDGDGIAEGLGEETLDGNSVTEWRDKSGLNNDALQSDVSLKPILVVNEKNGLPVIRFDGVNDILSVPDDDSLDGTSGLNFISVFDIKQVNGQPDGLISKRVNSSSNESYSFFFYSGNMMNVDINGLRRSFSTPFTSNTEYLLNITFDGSKPAAQRLKMYDQNTDYGFADHSASAILDTTSDLHIGAFNAGYSINRYYDGDMSELILHRKALDANSTESLLINQYQSAKWDIALDPLAGAATEASEAMDTTNGFGAFTTDYLERLSRSADIVLQATNDITLDLQNDLLALDTGRSISLTAGGNINDVSAGTVRTDNGNISLTSSGGNINLDTTNLEALNGGTVNMDASGSVDLIQTSAINLGIVNGSTVNIQTTGAASDITLNNTVTGSDADNALTIAAGRNFINNHGTGALNASHGSGRWLVYSADPNINTLGGLNGDFKRYNKTYDSYAPESVTGNGNGLLYSIAPALTVTAGNATREYGDANPAFGYSLTGFINGDTIATSGAASGSAAVGTTATNASNVGSYAITAALGTLVSDMGYQFSFTNGTLDITKANLDVVAEDMSFTQSTPTTPSFVFTGFKNNQTLANSGVTGDPDFLNIASLGALTVGSYTLDLDLSGLNSTNYSFSEGTPKGILAVVSIPQNDTSPSNLPSTVLQAISGGAGTNSGGAPQPTLQSNNMSDDKEESSANSPVILAQNTDQQKKTISADFIKIEKSIIDFYDLCSYNESYCE